MGYSFIDKNLNFIFISLFCSKDSSCTLRLNSFDSKIEFVVNTFIKIVVVPLFIKSKFILNVIPLTSPLLKNINEIS